MRFLRAFLRRLIIPIALELERRLVETREKMNRPHGRKAKPSAAKVSPKGLDPHKTSFWPNADGPHFKTKLKISDGHSKPIPVDMAKLYAPTGR
jgi:hypothetical protein